MDDSIDISFVVPVFNRPAEVEELLQSLCQQPQGNFEVVIVEDGYTQRCDDVVRRYDKQLNINYIYKDNSGPGPSRNQGAALAKGR